MICDRAGTQADGKRPGRICSLFLAVTLSPTSTVPLTFSTPLFAPGNVIGAQAVAFFDTAFPLPNGENGGFLFSNGVLSTTRLQ